MAFEDRTREDREHSSYRDAGGGLTKQAVEVENAPSNPIPIEAYNNPSQDILGVSVGGSRNNQIEISFDVYPDASLLTSTKTASGNFGSLNGHALFSTGVNTTAFAKGVSVLQTKYRPAHEIYSFFTAAFTTPTSANSYQRIGLYDTTNGFFIGYNGLSFGITKRSAGVDSFVSRSSWNTDLLTGGSSSKFTRNSIPESIDLTKSNLFRIRFAWLGSANILFEVFSPDGKWVLFHEIKQPNTSLEVSIQDPDLPMTVDVSKTAADATNLILYTACWAAGTTSDFARITETLTDNSLAMLTRSVITGRASTGGGTYYNAKVTPSGSLITAIGDISDVQGQKTMANSFPVVIASNQSTLPILGTVGYATVPAVYTSATVSYPTLTQEIYQYFNGATLVKTVTINYTNATKNDILNWTIT